MSLLSIFKKPKTPVKPLSFIDAVRGGKIDDVRNYLDAGVDPNQTVNDKNYPLYYAVHSGTEIVELLVQYGADINIRSKYNHGRSALHLASSEGYVDVITLLIKLGADVNIMDNYGHTPLFEAGAKVSPYDIIYANTICTPHEIDAYEWDRMCPVATLLKSHGAVPSTVDVETAKAMGTVPESKRFSRHMARANNYGDLKYMRALREVSMNYDYLHDAFRLLSDKENPSDIEMIFLKNFESYEDLGGMGV